MEPKILKTKEIFPKYRSVKHADRHLIKKGLK